MKIEAAAELDRILKSFTGQRNYATVEAKDTELCHRLKRLGMITIRIATPEFCEITITDKGNVLIASGGFTKQAEDEEYERNIKDATVRVAKRANWIASAALLVAVAAFFREELFSLFNYVFCLKQ